MSKREAEKEELTQRVIALLCDDEEGIDGHDPERVMVFLGKLSSLIKDEAGRSYFLKEVQRKINELWGEI